MNRRLLIAPLLALALATCGGRMQSTAWAASLRGDTSAARLDTAPKYVIAHELMADDDYWRRTANGWEWLAPPPPPARILTLHPVTLALFEMMASLLALMCFDRRR